MANALTRVATHAASTISISFRHRTDGDALLPLGVRDAEEFDRLGDSRVAIGTGDRSQALRPLAGEDVHDPCRFRFPGAHLAGLLGLHCAL